MQLCRWAILPVLLILSVVVLPRGSQLLRPCPPIFRRVSSAVTIVRQDLIDRPSARVESFFSTVHAESPLSLELWLSPKVVPARRIRLCVECL